MYLYVYIFASIYFLGVSVKYIFLLLKDSRIHFPRIPRRIESSNGFAEPPLHSGLGERCSPTAEMSPGLVILRPVQPRCAKVSKKGITHHCHIIWRPTETLWGWKRRGNLATLPGRFSIDTWYCTAPRYLMCFREGQSSRKICMSIWSKHWIHSLVACEKWFIVANRWRMGSTIH